jgi:uncharacterized protein (TIGR02147 family)
MNSFPQPALSTPGYRTRLVSELIQRQRKNSAYSLRSFARDLKISPAALSQAMSAKRNLSKTNLKKMAEHLALSPLETKEALSEIESPAKDIGDESFTTLHDDTFKLLSDWYYFAILSLAEHGGCKAEPEWLAERFGLSLMEARDALERLKRLNLVTEKRGKIYYDGAPLKTTTDIPSSTARSLQKDHLRLAAISLEADPIQLRDITSITMTIRQEKIPQAKVMIKKFRRRLAKFLEAGRGEEVYVAAIQLFPVSKAVK